VDRRELSAGGSREVATDGRRKIARSTHDARDPCSDERVDRARDGLQRCDIGACSAVMFRSVAQASGALGAAGSTNRSEPAAAR
jgi:hypothetical protein